MAHYGMYVNDTDGSDNIELEAESDISYTSLGGQPLMSNFISQQGGWYYSPLNRWIMEGAEIPLSKLRVVDPCWAAALCNGSGATTSDPTPPASTPPTSTPPVSAPPASATTPVSTAPSATTPLSPTPAPTPVASAPVTRPAPVTSPPAKHPTKKKKPKTTRRSNIAHIASVSARSCKAPKTSHTKKGAKRATCTSSAAAERRTAARR
jgi:hypothetical protein